MEDIPHVETIEQGLDNVDRVEIPKDLLLQSMSDTNYVASGKDMLCFDSHITFSSGKAVGITDSDTGNVLLVPKYNLLLSPEEAKNILQRLVNIDHTLRFDISPLESTIQGLSEETYEQRANNQSKQLLERVAAHNSYFRRGKISIQTSSGTLVAEVYPIKTILTYEGKPIGVVMQKAIGERLQSDEDLLLKSNLAAHFGDPNLGNIIKTGDGKGVVLDVTQFAPSSKDLSS